MTINLQEALQVSVLLNIFLFIWLILAERRKQFWEVMCEQKEMLRRIERDQYFAEGQLRTIERLVRMQDEMLEMRRNFSNYLLDLMFLALEGEDLKPHLDLVKDAIETEDED